MIKKVEELKTVTINHKYCDICGNEISRVYSNIRCEICGKDLCDKCVGYEVNTMGDYREVYCKKCWGLGTEYRSKIELLENQIEILTDQWYSECKK